MATSTRTACYTTWTGTWRADTSRRRSTSAGSSTSSTATRPCSSSAATARAPSNIRAAALRRRERRAEGCMDRPRRLGPLLLGLLVTLAGCQGPAAPAAPTAPAASLWPLYVTEDAGFADRAGVDIETTITNSASDGMNAMLGGSLDVNALGADAVILAQAHGADVIGVAGLTNRPPYSLLVQPEITQVEDLRGKTLGASSLKTGEVVF